MIVVSAEALQPSELLSSLEADAKHCGAVVSFTGKMRETGENNTPLKALYLEHYPDMTERSLENIVSRAKQKFHVEYVVLCHRVGSIYPDEPIVFVAVASEHRKASFDATSMIMDYLKNEAPFWKKEIYLDGSECWVAQKDSDQLAYKTWQ